MRKRGPEDRHIASGSEHRTETTTEELKAALAKSEARYEALVSRAGYGIYRSSADGRFLEANATLADMLGYSSVDELFSLDLPRDVYLDPDERGRIIRSPVSYNVRPFLPGRYGEEILAHSAD